MFAKLVSLQCEVVQFQKIRVCNEDSRMSFLKGIYSKTTLGCFFIPPFHFSNLSDWAQWLCAPKNCFFYIIALNLSWMDFFTWWKDVSFSRYLNFCVFDESANFKISDVIIGIRVYTFDISLLILGIIMANFSYLFSGKLSRLKTSSRHNLWFW